MQQKTLSQVMSPMSDIPEDHEGIDAIFRDANVTKLTNYDFDGQYPDPTEVDGEHLRIEFASPLLTQERCARIDLTQTHHSTEEGLLRSAPLISAGTGKPGSVLNEQEASRLEDERFMTALKEQREQILAEARFEIQKHVEKASFNEGYIRNL